MIDEIRSMMREVTDPVEFRRQMEDLFSEESKGDPVFTEGDTMPMHAFLYLFKKRVCEGNETRFWQWPVRIDRLGHELAIGLGTAITGKTGASDQERILGLFAKTKGALYYSGICELLHLDLLTVVNICNELLEEQVIVPDRIAGSVPK